MYDSNETLFGKLSSMEGGGRSVLIANKANHTVELGSVAALGLGGRGPVEMRQVNSRSVVDGVAGPQSLSLPGYSVTIMSTAR